MATDNGEIGPVGRTQFGGGHGAGAGIPTPEPGEAEGPARPARRLDDVVLTEPRLATLRLLRHRILERTRIALDLPRTALHGASFAALPRPSAEVFMGRLLSEQNLLASRRRDSWRAARVDAAIEEGMTAGLAETLEVLHDVGDLDAESWGLVCAVLHEFHRKVIAAAGREGPVVPAQPPE